ncbi:MAG: hypothetical protein HQM09_09665 [Candidatus Riflebacteria bacterium]|nr:hypothetical protein [Candidatus Riflebacteria bacterium]
MKRIISAFIPLALVAGLTLPVCAIQNTSGATMACKPGQTLTPSTKHVKNDGKKAAQKALAKPQVQPEIAKLADQYKSYRDKQAQVARAFEMLHNSASYGDNGQPTTPAPVSQEELRLPTILSQLQAIKTILEYQNDGGTGDVEYWLRTESILNRQGQSAVIVLNGMVQNDGGAMNPLLRSALTMASNNLNSAMHQYDGATGNADYWCGASAFARDSLHNAAANIGQIMTSLPTPQPGNFTFLLTGTAWVLETFLCADSDAGNGDADYWLRTQSLMCIQATSAACVLDNLMRLPNLPPLALTMIQSIANNLRSAASMYSSGTTGDANFWMNASGMVVNALNRAGGDLSTLRKSL